MRGLLSACIAAFALGFACPFTAGEARAKTLRVRIVDMEFQPATLVAAAGDTVEWTNDDFVDHSATASGGGFDVTVPAGKNAMATMNRKGRSAYVCRFHPSMTGVIEVK